MTDFLGRMAEVGQELAVEATMLFVLAIGLSLIWIKASAAQRHVVFSAALIGTLSLPVVSLSVPGWRLWPTSTVSLIEVTASGAAAMADGGNNVSVAGEIPFNPMVGDLLVPSADGTIFPGEAGFFRSGSMGLILAALWLTGVLCGCCRLLLGLARLRKITGGAEPATGQSASLLRELSRAMGISRPVQCLVSRDSISPMTWGWLQPVVILPDAAKSWSVERLRVVLLHELAHVRRSDFATQLAGELARSLYWFHPLSWWSLRCLRIEQEAACDDWVLASGAIADEYAEELLSITACLPHGFLDAGFAPAMGRVKRIEARVRSILASNRNRNRVETWRLTTVAILFAALAMLTAGVELVAVAENRSVDIPAMPDQAPAASENVNDSANTALPAEGTQDNAGPLSARSQDRRKEPGLAQQIQPTRENVSQVLRALRDKDLDVSKDACIVVAKMASQKVFAAEDLQSLWEGLQPKLRSQHQDTSEWSTRAVTMLVQESTFFSSPFWTDQGWMLERPPSDIDRLAGRFLNGALDESLLMLGSSDRELQRRGANLSSRLVKYLPLESQEKLIRSLLAIPFEPDSERNPDSPEVRCSRQVTIALILAAPEIKTESLANDVAARLLEATRELDMATIDGVHRGLAYIAYKTRGELRERIVSVVIAAAADEHLTYSQTSGIYTPPKHRGAEALTILAPLLTGDELAQAEKAIPPLPEGKNEAHDSMYLETLQALAARKQALELKPQPMMPEEEDLAFFERRYGRKINGVKPKSEYSDPDEFYSAVARELGISEIAWKAASEKFGWNKEDGRNTLAILKGGPTSEGGEGKWDILFLRSVIDPETQRPKPASLEQVMVQIDYDGNVTFPKIPKQKQ